MPSSMNARWKTSGNWWSSNDSHHRWDQDLQIQVQQCRGSSGKACGKCAQSHPWGECPVWGKKCHKCGNKNHFSTCCRSKAKGHGDSKKATHGRSRSMGPQGKGAHSRSKSGSQPRMRSTHSIELKSFQDHDKELHGRHPEEELHGELPADTDLHERLLRIQISMRDHHRIPFNTMGQVLTLLKRHFTISRSKSVGSISNKMDPEGKTKIIMMLQIKFHHNGIDNLRVRDNGAEANILPLDSFRTMFPHALDEQGYPKRGFLHGLMTNLECYDDGKLINHGSFELRLQHYSKNSFQDHTFYVVETRMLKDIIIGKPASSKLGLICVLCIKQAKKQLQCFLSRP